MSQKIRLDKLLYEVKGLKSRAEASALIMAGRVSVDGKKVDKAGFYVKPDVELQIKAGPRYVSRAGGKLASVADEFHMNFKNKIVLDVGSSTGGFTDFALQNGAIKVYAVDVGTNQLEWKLRQDPRVVVLEKTDIRDLQGLVDIPQIVVIDVSFISLRLVLPAVAQLIDSDTEVLPMVKPQFEADYKTASMHKGVIKNNTIRRGILKDMELWMQGNGWVISDKADSAVHGAKGNIERFYKLNLAKK
jgi:23S rRNA (cytidine1920-2'-O)/16S rRNA (cytidine1409-2'-O)-methyltransferase